jgi:hypothetical protein
MTESESQGQIFRTDQEIAERLKSYWEQYMKVVDLTITLATGSFLILANIVFSGRTIERLSSASLGIKSAGVAAAVFLGLGIFAATAWRMLSLTWMEIECIGSRAEANAYLERIGVTDQRVYAFQRGPSLSARRMWVWSKYASGACIIMSWALLLIFGIGLLS